VPPMLSDAWGDVIRLSLTRVAENSENSAVVVAMTTFALARSLVFLPPLLTDYGRRLSFAQRAEKGDFTPLAD